MDEPHSPTPFGEVNLPPLADLARMQLVSPRSLRSPFAGAPAVRDLAEEAGFPYLVSQAAQARGVGMDLEEEHCHSEHSWSQPSHSDAESAASSIGGRSVASSSLSSIGRADTSRALFNRRPRPPPTHRQGGSFASPVPASPDLINHEDTTSDKRGYHLWREDDDQRLIQLVEDKGPQQWSTLARILNIDRTGKQCRERCDPRPPSGPPPSTPSPTAATPKHWALSRLRPASLASAGRTRAGGSTTSPRTCASRGSGRRGRSRSSMLWSRGTSLRAARRSRGQRSPRCSRAARQHAQTFPQGVLSLAAAARATREQQQPAAPEAHPLAQG